MTTTLEKPRQISIDPSLKETIKKSLQFECAVEESEHNNQEALERLREEDRWLMRAYATSSGAVAGSVLVPEPVTRLSGFLGGMVASSLIVKRTQKINSVLRNADALDEVFKERQIQIFPDLPIPDQGRLDMLIKFPLPPKKTLFAIALRSQGTATITYREDKETFYIRRKKGGSNQWKPDHIERLALQEFWLRQNQLELFGPSHRDRNRSIVKLLVITGQTKIGQHADSLYVTIGDQKVLLLRRRSSIYVLQEEQLVSFIKGWLA